MHIIDLACRQPREKGRSLSQWDCSELARQLVDEGVVCTISSETVRRILAHHKLKPWRHHMWLNHRPRDADFYERVRDIIGLYTGPLAPGEVVLCLDEKTSLQPRPRNHPTKPARPGNEPIRVEHTYRRAGALNLFAAFDVHSGHVIGQCYRRKRQEEFIALLRHLDEHYGPQITTIHIVCDNFSTHSGKKVRAWLKSHSRFRLHFTPTHCSWLNQVEQWFSILGRKRFRIADFASLAHLADQIDKFISQWNDRAHPFNWSTKSVAKVMADAPGKAAA